MNNSISQTFSTKDYWLAGALLASGKRLLRLDWESGRAHFVLFDQIDCEQLTQAYWAGDLKVSAKAFTDALRTLKSRLYENGNEYEKHDNKQSNPQYR